MGQSMGNDILVIVVTYNGCRWVDCCFGSLRGSTLPVDIIVIDNGSTDGTVEKISREYPEVKIVSSGRNLGFGAANNLGMKYALEQNYGYVYLLNQDAWIFPDTIGKMVSISKIHPEFGVLSPVQLSGDETTVDNAFARACGESIRNRNNPEIAEVPFVMAAHWLIPTEVLGRVGGFSPIFYHYGEDNNYLDRIRYHGYRIGVLPGVRAVHDRKDRPETREKRLYLKDTSNLIRLSRPGRGMLRNILEAAFFAAAFSIKEVSLSPLKGYFSHLSRLGFIASNRKRSTIAGASYLE